MKMLEELVLSVGKREIDDKERVQIKGALIKPDRKINLGVLFVTGFNGHLHDYIEYFARQLGDVFPIYMTETRNRGWTSGSRIVADLQQIDEQIRDRLETDKIIYLGHSMGTPLGVEAAKRHGRNVTAYVGMATYPSCEDCYCFDQDISRNGLVRSLFGYLGRKTDFSIFSYPLKEAEVDAPIHFIVGNKDEWAGTMFEDVRQRFQNYFAKFNNGSYMVIPGNHCFNLRFGKLAPFNEDNPQVLINEVVTCLQKFE